MDYEATMKAAADAQAAADDARAVKIQPLRDLIVSDAWEAVLSSLQEQRPNFVDDPLAAHVRALTDVMPRLVTALDREPQAPTEG